MLFRIHFKFVSLLLLTHENIKKMVTYFNRKDLVNFGKYLLSENRTFSIISNTPVCDNDEDFEKLVATRLKEVYHSDVENFLESIKKIE